MVSPDLDTSLVGNELDGRYEVLELIGAGGVGNVYRARLLTLDRVVAIKVLHESAVQNAEFVRRFEREARAMSRLHHPHCVAVIDSGMVAARPFLVLEYLPGQTVTKLLEHGPFPPARAVGIALQLLEALEYFHGHHVIHRDLKSENVMLVPGGASTDFVKVLDFGMAKILEGDGADSQLSKIGLIPGTASSMAPEQIQQLPPDLRIDIYAAGILLYEMVVGHRPFRGGDAATIVRQQVSAPPPPPRQQLGEDALSAELEAVILKALAKNREQRFASAHQMAEALRLTPEGRPSGSRPAASAPVAVEDSPSLGLLEIATETDAQKPPRAAPVDPPQAAAAPSRRSPPPLPVAPMDLRPRRRSLPVGVVLAVGGVVAAVAWAWRRSPGLPPPPPPPAPAVVAAPKPPSPPPTGVPPPAPVPEPWLAHRDLAVAYLARGQPDEAFREVKAAVSDNAAAARTDAALVDAAVSSLTANRVPFVVDVFRANPRLVEDLAGATAHGTRPELRHAALQGLQAIGQQARADTVAMSILDLRQARACPAMRTAWKRLRGSKDPRVGALVRDLLTRGHRDRQAKCLGRALRR